MVDRGGTGDVADRDRLEAAVSNQLDKGVLQQFPRSADPWVLLVRATFALLSHLRCLP
jgi:hypothetical protein